MMSRVTMALPVSAPLGVVRSIDRARLVAITLALLLMGGTAAEAMPSPAPAIAASSSSASTNDRIGDLASSLDHDLVRIFRFVADEIRYEPYVGILRGALGTLDAGAGNSLDQALLLAALLDESAVTYRFARGPLDEVAAERLLESSLMDSTEATNAAETALDGGPYPAKFIIPPHEAADPQELSDIEAAAGRAVMASDQHLSDSVALITTALADAGIELGDANTSASPWGSLPGSEMTEHTWVQAASGADWLELDPSLAAQATIGQTLASATETLDALPDQLRHTVRFEVLLEQVRGEGLQASPVIEYERFADELGGRTITLVHVTPSEGMGSALSSRFVGDAKLSYRPVLLIPGGSIVGDEIAISSDSPVGGGLLDDDSGFFGGASSETSTLTDGEATAEWVSRHRGIARVGPRHRTAAGV